MYDHFNMDDPKDTKFLADMFIVQKEYRKAFTEGTEEKLLEGSLFCQSPGTPICNQSLVTKIEQCIDNLCEDNNDPDFKNERNLYAEQLKCCILTKSPNLLKFIPEKFMPKIVEEDFEKQNEALACYLMPSKENLSSFAPTLENGTIRIEDNNSFECSSYNRTSNKISFAMKENEVKLRNNQKEDESCVLHDSQIVHVKIVSDRDQNDSDTYPNTSDSGSKQEIYNVRLEDDDLVICQKEDLDQSKKSNFRTINLDLCDDQVESPMEDAQAKTRNLHGADFERIIKFNSRDELADPQYQNGTAEFRKSTKNDSEEDNLPVERYGSGKNQSEAKVENIQDQNDIQLEPTDTFSSSTIHKNMKPKYTGGYMPQLHRKNSGSHMLSDLNFTQENLNISSYSKYNEGSFNQDQFKKTIQRNMSPKPQIMSIKKHVERLRKSSTKSTIRENLDNHAQKGLENKLSPIRNNMHKCDTSSSLLSYSKFKDKLRKNSRSQNRTMHRKKNRTKVHYKTNQNVPKPSVNSTCINLYSSMNGRAKKSTCEESSGVIRSIAQSLRSKMDRNRSQSKIHAYQTVDTDISISCKVPGGKKARNLRQKEACSKTKTVHGFTTSTKKTSLNLRKKSLVGNNLRLMNRKRSTYF
ncbi:unnamed protein product [Moneuplotes crassus]|uniref:Uncharacterized protein n=1 Tax=Euplotes crassus TaxID=5936 RepID=A0AAD1Y9N8_EUPCR|nr:unnamed protein product [Moneuplotes crassus]